MIGHPVLSWGGLVVSLVMTGCAATHPAPISSHSEQLSPPAEKPSPTTRTAPTNRQPAPATQNAAPLGEEAPIEWSWPLERSYPAVFSPLAKGIDFTAKAGEPVLAAASGTVSYVGDGLKNYGQMIVIKHSPSYLSVYANNGKILVKDGQTVKRGEKIAEMGESGNGKWHFEIRHQGKPVDPARLLPSNRH
ncbi:MAG: peptidoglycan DD-metalloendopeptidase family protein [Betaproteobacteria bacterium]|nr:peptidoglycan DD-metalloendopeptidase family protein [Betaproteobacteria bacterium]